MPGIVLGKILPDLAAGPLAKITKRKAPGFLNKPTRRVLESLTSNQELIAVLTGQWGDNGLPPAQSSFIIHALIACAQFSCVLCTDTLSALTKGIQGFWARTTCIHTQL
jgi:hypothetical protein